MKRKIVVGGSVAALVLAAGVGIAAAGSGSTNRSGPNSQTAGTPSAPDAEVGLGSTSKLGTFLVDSHGRTLYVFQKDIDTVSSCYAACAAIWPPLTVSTAPHARVGVKASQLGLTTRTGGQTEITYNGHPLYFYAADSGPGQAQGQGLNQFGGSWHVIAPSGAVDNAA